MILAVTLGLLLSQPQIPSPDASTDQQAPLQAEYQRILSEEIAAMQRIVDTLRKEGQDDAAKLVDAMISPMPPAGIQRFVPLPEIVSGRAGEGLANLPVGSAPAPVREARDVRAASAKKLFELASRAAAPGVTRYAIADRALRAVLERDPDHAEARRLLGFLPYKGGWATPHAAMLLSKGYVLHPKVGWVQDDWVPHLDRGELPGTFTASGKPREWLPADQANAMRQDWSKAWQIKTAPHFEIQTNVPLDEGVAFARRLEGLHDFFFSEFADVIGSEYLPLADRFRNPSQKPTVSNKKYYVSYFADKSEYVDFFRRQFRQDESISLGYYMPLADARRFRVQPRAYFYRDEANPIESHATLYHEASHQLLFETVKSGIDPNRPNYWIWEGLGTYFETLSVNPDGSMTVGGFTGPRMEQARLIAGQPGKLLPIADLCDMDRDEFGSLQGDAVYRNYAEAMALTVYLMNGEDGRYRARFLDFVADAYRGKNRSTTLAERLGISFEKLDQGFQAFLKTP